MSITGVFAGTLSETDCFGTRYTQLWVWGAMDDPVASHCPISTNKEDRWLIQSGFWDGRGTQTPRLFFQKVTKDVLSVRMAAKTVLVPLDHHPSHPKSLRKCGECHQPFIQSVITKKANSHSSQSISPIEYRVTVVCEPDQKVQIFYSLFLLKKQSRLWSNRWLYLWPKCPNNFLLTWQSFRKNQSRLWYEVIVHLTKMSNFLLSASTPNYLAYEVSVELDQNVHLGKNMSVDNIS